MTEGYYTETYITEWKDKDNVIISLWHWVDFDNDAPEQVGVVELAVYKHGEHEGEALVWNLYVNKEHRGKGLAREIATIIVTQAADDSEDTEDQGATIV